MFTLRKLAVILRKLTPDGSQAKSAGREGKERACVYIAQPATFLDTWPGLSIRCKIFNRTARM